MSLNTHHNSENKSALNENNTTNASSTNTVPTSLRISTRLTPFRQFLVISLSAIGIMLFMNIIGKDADQIWFVAFTGMVLYAWINAIIGFFARQKAIKYIGLSWLFYAIMCLTLLTTAHYLSVLNLSNLYEFRTLFIANLIFYFVGTFVVSIMRGIAFLTGIEY